MGEIVRGRVKQIIGLEVKECCQINAESVKRNTQIKIFSLVRGRMMYN